MDKILWKGKDVLKITNGHGPSNWNASGVSIDTRTIKKGDIFFALAGPNYDGHQFIGEAIKKGASIVISNAPVLNNENKVYNYNLFKNPYYRIGDNFTSMQDNRKRMLSETDNCTKINSIGKISCKKIYGYNFYFLNKK